MINVCAKYNIAANAAMYGPNKIYIKTGMLCVYHMCVYVCVMYVYHKHQRNIERELFKIQNYNH